MSDIPMKRHRLPNGRFDFEYKETLAQEFLKQKYLEEKLSASQIAQIVGCCKATVLEALRRFNIPRRNRSYALHLRSRKNFNLTKEVKNYIDGLLLGDGHILQKSKWSARYDQCFSIRFREWAEKIREDFLKFGIESNLLQATTRETVIKKTGQRLGSFAYVMLFTKFYEEFVSFRKRWYVNGVKVIPRDIELTAQLLANFHMGDGEYDPSTGRVAFSVNSFSLDDVKFLIEKLEDVLGIKAKVYLDRRQNNQPRIKLGRKDSEIFLNFIRPFKVTCFQYKWGE